MAVVYGITNDLGGQFYTDQVREGRECFYCAKRVLFPAIHWIGPVDTWLHPDCAMSLACGLLLDYRNIVTGKGDPWGKEMKMRDRLAHEEQMVQDVFAADPNAAA